MVEGRPEGAGCVLMWRTMMRYWGARGLMALKVRSRKAVELLQDRCYVTNRGSSGIHAARMWILCNDGGVIIVQTDSVGSYVVCLSGWLLSCLGKRLTGNAITPLLLGL